MSDRTTVQFNAPVEQDIVPPKPPQRGDDLDHSGIQKLCLEMINKGFNEGAIVVRRSEASYDRRRHLNWGMVTSVHRYRYHGAVSYAPLSVKWFLGSPIMDAWPEDLLLVYPAMTSDTLDAFFKDQE